ncbi:uncharacterized protein BDV17DRAFT_291840 [Aspergillus undulatus]|uniref:uncharacterized protein n=1 Tax=Aspergillus undulatus TaxID=1810928 RepID=UPI003CCCC1B6
MVNSGYIMRKNIDSIVQPGKYTSHMHSFFGNDAVNVTNPQLRNSCPAVPRTAIRMIWHPTLYVNNGTDIDPVEARYFKAYYQKTDTAEVPCPSTNFTAVAGNATAMVVDEVDELWNMSWCCEYGPQTSHPNGWPDAGCNLGRLRTQLLLPDCVNPTALASGYSSCAWLANANRCPDGMKRIPSFGSWSASIHPASYLTAGLAAENMMLATDKRQFQAVTGPPIRAGDMYPKWMSTRTMSVFACHRGGLRAAGEQLYAPSALPPDLY